MDHRGVVELAGAIEGDLARRVDFLLEIDKLKSVERRNRLVDASRYENSAEHSWHLAMMATVLAPYAGPDVDVGRAIEILLVHDIVEVDAGDAYIYDERARADKEWREQEAATRLFGLLPVAEGERFMALWQEYEARESPTARFAYAVDRLQPLLMNAASGGVSWLENGIRNSQAVTVNAPIVEGAAELWAVAAAVLDRVTDEALLVDDRSDPVPGS